MASEIDELFDEDEPPLSADDQVEELLGLATVFKNALEVDVSKCCPNCGFIEPCKTDKECEAHNDAFALANRRLNSTLSKPSFWYMWVNCQVPFLETHMMQAVRSKIAPVH